MVLRPAILLGCATGDGILMMCAIGQHAARQILLVLYPLRRRTSQNTVNLKRGRLGFSGS